MKKDNTVLSIADYWKEIIDEVEQVERAKNQKLADSINKHFELVEWHLWDLRKNGDYIEVVDENQKVYLAIIRNTNPLDIEVQDCPDAIVD